MAAFITLLDESADDKKMEGEKERTRCQFGLWALNTYFGKPLTFEIHSMTLSHHLFPLKYTG